jgi:hypothetical protein
MRFGKREGSKWKTARTENEKIEPDQSLNPS